MSDIPKKCRVARIKKKSLILFPVPGSCKFNKDVTFNMYV